MLSKSEGRKSKLLLHAQCPMLTQERAAIGKLAPCADTEPNQRRLRLRLLPTTCLFVREGVQQRRGSRVVCLCPSSDIRQRWETRIRQNASVHAMMEGITERKTIEQQNNKTEGRREKGKYAYQLCSEILE